MDDYFMEYRKELGIKYMYSPPLDGFWKGYINWLEHRFQTISQQSLSGSEPKGSTPKRCGQTCDCEDCGVKKECAKWGNADV